MEHLIEDGYVVLKLKLNVERIKLDDHVLFIKEGYPNEEMIVTQVDKNSRVGDVYAIWAEPIDHKCSYDDLACHHSKIFYPTDIGWINTEGRLEKMV